mmetsp:Transcript_47716/g.121757  ORF Transcript_47716/g.121757 Transcript_47716/m.121757 type:complete len:231 (+) Transcript_47716:1430-2122(+)
MHCSTVSSSECLPKTPTITCSIASKPFSSRLCRKRSRRISLTRQTSSTTCLWLDWNLRISLGSARISTSVASFCDSFIWLRALAGSAFLPAAAPPAAGRSSVPHARRMAATYTLSRLHESTSLLAVPALSSTSAPVRAFQSVSTGILSCIASTTYAIVSVSSGSAAEALPLLAGSSASSSSLPASRLLLSSRRTCSSPASCSSSSLALVAFAFLPLDTPCSCWAPSSWTW